MGNLSDDIIKYKKGELNPREMHVLEKKALADPFLAEALEGMENISPEVLRADISAIESRVRGKKKTILFTPLRIAAGVVFLVGSVFLIYQFIPKPEAIALKSEKPKPEIKHAESEKQSAGSGKGVEKTKNQKGAVENKTLKAERKGHESGGLKSAVKREEQPSTKVQQSEPKNDNAESEILAPIQQSPVQDLAAGQEQQAKIENAEDQRAKKITGPEQKAAGAKPISSERKKGFIEVNEDQRSAQPSTKMETPKSISGQVVSSEDGSPLPGVNVILKGTTIGTVTDSNGSYKISTDLDTQRLVFSFIGLQSQEIDVSGLNKIDVQMKDDVSQLSEVVVTALGVTKDDRAEPVMKWAEPEGGRKAYDKYLESNVVYPAEALKNKIKGKAGIEFTVGTDGSLSEFRVIKKLGYGCEDEVIRLVKDGPRWNPTTEDNKPIESTVRVRLRFDPAKTGR